MGTYFVIPLKTSIEKIECFRFERRVADLQKAGWELFDWRYRDLNASTNGMFLSNSEIVGGKVKGSKYHIGREFKKPVNETVYNFFTQKAGMPEELSGKLLKCCDDNNGITLSYDSVDADEFSVETNNEFRFKFRCIHLAMMHTGVGFLILGMETNNIATFDKISSTGYNENSEAIYLVKDNEYYKVDLAAFIEYLLEGTGFVEFYNENSDTMLRNSIIYNSGVKGDIQTGNDAEELKEVLEKYCLNMRHARHFGDTKVCSRDMKSFMSYAVVNGDREDGTQSIRFGVYTAFTRVDEVQYLDGQETIDPINVDNEDNENNYLPLLLIVLYEWYSCNLFTEIVRNVNNISSRTYSWINNQMMCLKAFGVMLPNEITPYDNINLFFEQQREIYDIEKFVALIDDKIKIVNQLIDDKRKRVMELAGKILAVFGVVSIICDTLGIVGMLNNPGGLAHVYRVTFMVEIVIALILGFAMLLIYLRKNHR